MPQGLIVKSCGADFEAYDLALFIAPRRKLLEDGTLTEFGEWEVSERTEVLGQVAQRMSIYRKRGRLQGVPFDTHGVKSLQFVKTPAGWRIAALAWDDEREGLELPRRLEG